jgi:hypothetical protein
VRKKAVAIFRELFLSGSLQEHAPPASAAAGGDGGVLKPLLLPEANGRAARALLTLLQRNTDPREEESIRDALQSMFDEIWFGPPRAALRGGGARAAVVAAAAPKDPAPSRVGASLVGGAAAGTSSKSDASLAALHVAAELAQRTSQLASLVDSTGSSSRGVEWLSELLRRLLTPPQPGAADATTATPLKPHHKSRSAAAGPFIPGIGPWSAAAAASAFVARLITCLQLLSTRRSALVALQQAGAGGDAPIAAASSSTAAAVSGGRGGGQPPPAAIYREARDLYEREVVAALTALKAFAQASPALFSFHVHVLAPYLRGDALLLSPGGNLAVQHRTASLLELVVPACSPPADLSLVESIVADLVRLLKVRIASPPTPSASPLMTQ